MVTRIRRSARPHLYLTEWFEHLGVNDEKVAGRLDVARETVFRWRKEQHRLNPEKMAQLASALNIQPEELWRPPSRPSVDVLLKDKPDEMQATALDIVRRLVQKAG